MGLAAVPGDFQYRVDAFNTATESTNRMHDDLVAQKYGFRGGLVPGVDVWAYMTRPCIDRWGQEFLTSGTMSVRLLAPIYDGESVVSRLDAAGALEIRGPDDAVRASGTASVGGLPNPLQIEDTSDSTTAIEPPLATQKNLAEGTVLDTIRFTYRRAPAAEYLDDIRETNGLYQDGAICHPGFLARQANYVLSLTVRLGPWIHVSTTAHHRLLIRDGDSIEVRGIVTNEFERKGHRYVDLAVEITANEIPAWSASHTAIWKPR